MFPLARRRRPLAASIALFAVAVFGVYLTTLRCTQFNLGVETLAVETALEIRRGGSWIFPTLEGEPRIRKPPLTAWIAASAIQESTLRQLSSPDTATRTKASSDLSFEVRWPSLLCGMLSLLAIGDLAAALAGRRIGLLAAVIAGTSLLFVSYARSTLTDVPLLLWNSFALAATARWIFGDRPMLWASVVGMAMGLAIMSKGPVSLAHVAAPAIVFVVLRRLIPQNDRLTPPSRKPQLLPIAIAVAFALLVGGAWFVFVAQRTDGVIKLWAMEVFRTDPTEKATTRWYSYGRLLPLMTPWSLFCVVGLWTCGCRLFGRLKRKQGSSMIARRALFALLIVVVPLLVMSCFRDRKARYLLSFVGPCSILAAIGVEACFRALPDLKKRHAVLLAHWFLFMLCVVGFPVAVSTAMVWELRPAVGPVLTSVSTAGWAAILILLPLAIWRWGLRSSAGVAFVTAIGFLVTVALALQDYSRTADSRSEVKPLADFIRERVPDAVVYRVPLPPKERVPYSDLSIYLGQITPTLPRLADVPQIGEPQVIVCCFDGDDAIVSPSGWRLLAKVPRGRDWWVAFTRDLPTP